MKTTETSIKNSIRNNIKIGVLGGGQLARMLCDQGHKMGLEVHVLSQHKNDPAALVTRHWHKGSYTNLKDLKTFAAKVDMITYESEFADTQVLKQVKSKYVPSLKNISTLQDRLTQKISLTKHKLPTSPFIHTSDEMLITQFYKKYKGFVAKKRMFGYDGYGTVIVKNKKQLDAFLKLSDKDNYIIEAFIPFKRELSIICARTSKGQFIHYPTIESVQKDAKCFSVKGPVTHSKSSTLIKKLKNYLTKINYVGVIAFELFDNNNDLIINEVAPRVHNTGHHTLDSFAIDQFSLHLHCLLGHKVPALQPYNKGFAMINLIGSKKTRPKLTVCKQSKLHWYEKKDNRPGRKMGHINSMSSSADKALLNCKKDLKGFDL